MLNVKIDLKYDKGFSWYKISGFYFKGYLFHENECFEGIKAINYIKEKICQYNDIVTTVRSLSGVFSLICQSRDQLYICCDRMRTFPVFYSFKNGLTISDDPEICTKKNPVLNNLSSTEFLHTGYVTGNNTLISDVFQVQAGELLTYNNKKFTSVIYHEYILKTDPWKSKHRTGVVLKDIITDISERLVNSIEKKTPVIPLSGGYDSRLVAVMLKSNGIENAICFTYGRKSNPEVRLSKKVAKLLGYKWYFIEYNDDLIKDYLDNDDFKKYFKFSSSMTSMFYMQEYFAVRELKKVIPEDSVFIPGHSGDFFAGSHLDSDIIKYNSAGKILKKIFEKHYNLRALSKKNKQIFFEKISIDVLKHINNTNYTYFENWDLKERQSKFIVNSSRIYEHFGFEHRLPLMDYDLMDYFIKINPKQKLHKLLYNNVLNTEFFNRYMLNFKKEIQATQKDINIQKLKERAKKVIPPVILDKYKYKYNKAGDTYYYIGITDQMKKEMVANKIKVDKSGRDKNSIIVQWYLYKLGELL